MTQLRYLAILCLIFLTPLLGLAGDSARHVKSVAEVLEHWQANQHLYVKGKLGVSQKNLDALEQWLNKNGKNWTVVLMQNARGEQWKNHRGHLYYGMDAVEYALGNGLSNNTQFLEQKHPKTKTSNGAIFVLFLDERKLSYFASEAYDARGLGESSWRGVLDASAIKAMRQGGGVVAATTATVSTIDRLLVSKLHEEARREQQRQSQLIAAKAWVDRMTGETKTVIKEAQKLSIPFKQNPALRDGDFAQPPINDWLETLDHASRNNDPILAKAVMQKLGHELIAYRDQIRQWSQDISGLEQLGKEIDSFEPHPDQLAAEIQLLKDTFREANGLHQQGQSSYRQALLDTQSLLQAKRSEKEHLVELDAERARQQAKAAHQRKVALTTGGGIAGAGLLGLGVYSNRRRRKQKAHAEKLYQEWRAAMKSRVDKLFSTMDRAGVVIGSERELEQRGYAGDTREESLLAIRQIDQAFVLSANVDAALEKAKNLIFPSNPVGKVGNIFRRASYDDAIDLLERKPVSANPENQTLKVANRSEESMLGDKHKTDKVELPFYQLIEKFDNSLASANVAIDTVDDAWSTISSRCETLGAQLDKIESEDAVLDHAAAHDGLFLLDALYDHCLPEAEKLHAAGIETGKHDPVKALRGPLQRGEVMASEMLELIALVHRFRSDELPAILRSSQQLDTLGRRSKWIEENLIDLDDGFEARAMLALTDSIQEEINTFSSDLLELKPRTEHALKLAKQAEEEIPEAISASQKSADKTRKEIATALQLDSSDILHEHPEWDPNALLTEAENFRLSCQQMLDQGQIPQAQRQADLAEQHITTTLEAIQQTLDAHADYPMLLEKSETLERKTSSLTTDATECMTELQQKYHRDALLVDPSDAEHGSLVDSIEALQGLDRQIESDISSARSHHAKGGLLQARERLEMAIAAHQHSIELHQLVVQRRSELQDLEQKNTAQLRSYSSQISTLQQSMEDPRITRATQQQHQLLETALKSARLAVEAAFGSTNPFHAAELLVTTNDSIVDLEARIVSDREAFAACEAKLTQLRGQNDKAQQLVQTAASDGIQDSQTTTAAIDSVRECEELIERHATILKQAHVDWHEIDQALQQTGDGLNHVIVTLSHDLERAQQAVAILREASRQVSSALNWSGSYGVRIGSSTGSGTLTDAQEALHQGNYQEASALASSAINLARSAIATANAEVSRIRRQRAEEARRARMRRRSSSSSFSSGSSFSSSRSSFSSGSSSRSSFGSSSSGFSRSGW